MASGAPCRPRARGAGVGGPAGSRLHLPSLCRTGEGWENAAGRESVPVHGAEPGTGADRPQRVFFVSRVSVGGGVGSALAFGAPRARGDTPHHRARRPSHGDARAKTEGPQDRGSPRQRIPKTGEPPRQGTARPHGHNPRPGLPPPARHADLGAEGAGENPHAMRRRPRTATSGPRLRRAKTGNLQDHHGDEPPLGHAGVGGPGAAPNQRRGDRVESTPGPQAPLRSA